MSKKLFSGPKLRRFREQRALTQVELARTLEISASYLNQIENNQRPLTAAVLLKLSNAFDIDLQMLSGEEDGRLAAELGEAMADPLFHAEAGQGRAAMALTELREVVALSPDFARRFLTLYRAWRASEPVDGQGGQVPGEPVPERMHDGQFPFDQVRDYFFMRDNYIDELDVAAESLQAEQSFRVGNMEEDLTRYLMREHGVTCVFLNPNGDELPARRYEPETRTLHLSVQLPQSRRCFHLANQLCRLEHSDLIERIVADAGFSHVETQAVCRVGLANYYAASLLMPYARFLTEAREYRYDIEKLELRFGVTFESVCHRLSSMQRPSARGVPFYFVRVDMAGNISKRQCAPNFHFARSGGACPLWNIHAAFATPGKILTQVAQMPDERTYFCIARTETKSMGGYLEPERKFAIGFGCEIRHAPELVYSAGIDLGNAGAVVPIGPSCRACERPDCAQRACPPVGQRLNIDENRRDFRPYRFR